MTIKIPKSGYLRIKVIPKSHKTEFIETMIDGEGEETIKIRLKAVPEKGKANAELIKFLSKELNIAKSEISIISGKTDQLKLIRLDQKSVPDQKNPLQKPKNQ
jgi:uncharacterized protein (TIGR00251 family)